MTAATGSPPSRRSSVPGEAAVDRPAIASSLEVAVPELLAGVRADRAVAMLGGISRRVAADLVSAGQVQVDGRPAAAATRLAAGQVLRIEGLGSTADDAAQADPAVSVVVRHADADLVVVDKAPGMVVHPGAGRERATLIGGLLARYPDIAQLGEGVCDPARPGIVHRLDRPTSGLLVVARTERAYRSLVAQFAERSVRRRYDAAVWGRVADRAGVVDAPIGRSDRDPTRMAVVASGRPARTRYTVVRRLDGPAPATVLALQLETGRTHQIRVHLSALGHPVVGDTRYGAPPGPTDAVGAGRLFLHAATLGFRHPATGASVEWSSPLPEDLAHLAANWSSITAN